MIEATFGLLQFILILYLAMSLASILTLMSKYKNYKETYLLLGKYILVENSKKYILLASKEEIDRISGINTGRDIRYLLNKEIYYEKKDGTIKLNDSYIFNNSMLYFDIYSLYWYYKLKRRFIRKGMSLSELREEKLNKLLG